MPKPWRESHRWTMTRKNIKIDHALINAETIAYSLYYLYLREHPELATVLEQLLLQLDRCRCLIRDFQYICWASEPENFADAGTMRELIVEARIDVLGRKPQCRGFLEDLARGESELSNLLLQLGAQLPKRSDLLDH